MADIVVIGYGNAMRSDDGLGLRVAEAIAEANYPGVRVRTVFQLVPELAPELAETRLVIFVDALVDSGGSVVALTPVEAEEITDWSTHAADPRTLLALTRSVFGRTPEAWWLKVPGRQFDFGEGLSSTAEDRMRQAISRIEELIQAKTQCRPRAGDKTCTN